METRGLSQLAEDILIRGLDEPAMDPYEETLASLTGAGERNARLAIHPVVFVR
jgi:hypothetical protein